MAVILNTSLGDIVIDLHTELCPLTSKNFLKLCKLKYYNNCLFHDVKKDFIAQTGDPSGSGSGGDSVYKQLYGDQARFFNDEFHPKLTHDKIGTVAMASAGVNLNASQFYITLRAGLDYLDGKHTVFGEVAEGLETLLRINEAYVDDHGRPYKNIRIKHVDILDDPFEDPPQLEDLIPDKSPEVKPPAEGEEVRLEDDWIPMDEQMDAEELDKSLRKKEAHSRAVVLEMIGDIPEAEAAPPENVLFICKLNPVTEEGDLETIFSRFGKIISNIKGKPYSALAQARGCFGADIIRDYKTGESLCYGFIEFDNKESCEAAYFKMDNVLIDDRRIHVDFSQSVAKLWTRFRKIGSNDEHGQGVGREQFKAKGGGCFNCGEYGHLKKDCPYGTTAVAEQDAAPVEMPKYTLKESAGQRGNPQNRYEMVFEEGNEASLSNAVDASTISKASHSVSGRLSKRPLEGNDDGRRARARFMPKDVLDGRNDPSEGNERPRHRFGHDRGYHGDTSRRSGLPSSYRDTLDDRRDQSRRNERPRDGDMDERDRRDYSGRNERPRKKYGFDSPDADVDTQKRARSPFSVRQKQDGRRGHSAKYEHHRDVPRGEKSAYDERRSQSPSSVRQLRPERRGHSVHNGQHRKCHAEKGPNYGDNENEHASPPLSWSEVQDERRGHPVRNGQHKERYAEDRSDSDIDDEKRAHSPVSLRQKQDDRRDHSGRYAKHRHKYVEERTDTDDDKQKRSLPSLRQGKDDKRSRPMGNGQRRERYAEERDCSDDGDQKTPPRERHAENRRRSDDGHQKTAHRKRYAKERTRSDDSDQKTPPRERYAEGGPHSDNGHRKMAHIERYAEDSPHSDDGDQKMARSQRYAEGRSRSDDGDWKMARGERYAEGRSRSDVGDWKMARGQRYAEGRPHSDDGDRKMAQKQSYAGGRPHSDDGDRKMAREQRYAD